MEAHARSFTMPRPKGEATVTRTHGDRRMRRTDRWWNERCGCGCGCGCFFILPLSVRPLVPTRPWSVGGVNACPGTGGSVVFSRLAGALISVSQSARCSPPSAAEQRLCRERPAGVGECVMCRQRHGPSPQPCHGVGVR